MEQIIKAVSDAGLGIGSLALIAYLFITQSIRQDKKDKAYIETLAIIQSSIVKMQADADKNWAVTQEISRTVATTTQALAKIKCINN